MRRFVVALMTALSLAAAAMAQPEPVLDQVCPVLGCSVPSCGGDLASCEAALANAQFFPATGQTTKYAAGDDGDLKKGAALSYTDNGDGTVTDHNTKLVWEKKDTAGTQATNLHHVSNVYPWAGTCSAGGAFCGTDADCSSGTCNASDGQGTGYTIFKWVAALNAASFAGHNDWRIPNVRELQSIVDYGKSYLGPTINAAFAPTQSSFYWSSTSFAGDPLDAWDVYFYDGGVFSDYKPINFYVRAVRGGS